MGEPGGLSTSTLAVMGDRQYSWLDAEAALNQAATVTGGFSTASRGIIVLPDNTRAFVKTGVDDITRQWATKEIAVYRFLNKYSYPYVPRLLAYNEDETSFVLEALLPTEGWDWSEVWNEQRLDHTLDAMDTLAAIRPIGDDLAFLNTPTVDDGDDGWRQLAASPQLQQSLISSLRDSGHHNIALALNFDALAERSSHFTFRHDVLVHNDVRADNCAWNAYIREVKLVDWNWTCLGDRRIDLTAMLVHACNAGLNVLPRYESRVDPEALRWMTGYWWKSAASPIWPGGPQHLRQRQLEVGITAHALTRALDGDDDGQIGRAHV